MLRLQWLLIFLALPFGAVAATAGKSKVTADAETKPSWGLSAAIYQMSPYQQGELGTTDTYLLGNYKIDSKQTLSFLQTLNKKYEIIAGEDEWDFSDTALRYSFDPKQKFLDFDVKGRAEVTLPLSAFSIKHQVRTKPELRLYLNKKLVDDRLVISLQPLIRYYVNTYTTTVTGIGSNGGRPLKHWKTGLTTTVDYKLNENFALNSSQGWARVYYEETLKNQTRLLGLRNPPNHEYFWDISLNYSATDKLSFGIGHTIFNNAESKGGIEIVAFDDQVAQWYLNAGYTFK